MLTESLVSAAATASNRVLGDQMTSILDAIADGVTVQDQTGQLVYANAIAAGLIGFDSVGELLAAEPASVGGRFEMFDVTGTQLGMSDLPARHVIAGEDSREQLVHFRVRSSGGDRWAMVKAQVMRGPAGERWAVNTFRDITERHRSENRAAENQRQILNSLTDPFSVLDHELRIIHCNDAGARMIGMTPEQVIGLRVDELAPEARASPVYRVYEQVMRTKQSAVHEEYYAPWDRWFESSIYPLDDGLVVYTRDVTMRKHALELTTRLARHSALRADVSMVLADERDLAKMLQRTCELLVDHLDVAFARIWTLDDPGTTLLLQASAGMYTHIDGGHKAVPVGSFKIGRIAASKKPHLTNDVPHDSQVGNPEWAAREKMLAFAGYPLLVDGDVVGVMAMFSRQQLPEDTMSALASIADVVAQGLVRRRTQLELEQRVSELARSNADLEQFAYVASHDLQEPLRMVASYNQLLARRYKGKLGEDADEFIGFTVEGVTRMQRLINDLLAYSRVGTRSNERADVDLEQVLALTLQNLERAIAESNAQITHDPLPHVLADEGQMLQLLQNLIGNAIKFRSEDVAKIHVGVRTTGREVVFSIRDNGIGIDPQYFERIFVIFQRLNPREKYPGTGIGLAICKKIIDRHGGRIWVESSPGSGSTVYFTVPYPRRAT